jgi:hypothetical protein
MAMRKGSTIELASGTPVIATNRDKWLAENHRRWVKENAAPIRGI